MRPIGRWRLKRETTAGAGTAVLWLLIPASAETCGHGTTGLARFWRRQLLDFLAATPRRTM
ncbi:MAG TPA: hypothetical protein VGC09_06950 [Rhodopila sp.]